MIILEKVFIKEYIKMIYFLIFEIYFFNTKTITIFTKKKIPTAEIKTKNSMVLIGKQNFQVTIRGAELI